MSERASLTNSIPCRFSDEDMALIRQAAADDDRGVSDFVRRAVRVYLRQHGYADAPSGVTAEQAFALGQAAIEMGVEPR